MWGWMGPDRWWRLVIQVWIGIIVTLLRILVLVTSWIRMPAKLCNTKISSTVLTCNMDMAPTSLEPLLEIALMVPAWLMASPPVPRLPSPTLAITTARSTSLLTPSSSRPVAHSPVALIAPIFIAPPGVPNCQRTQLRPGILIITCTNMTPCSSLWPLGIVATAMRHVQLDRRPRERTSLPWAPITIPRTAARVAGLDPLILLTFRVADQHSTGGPCRI
mmetsp:Transcript_9076/g.19628  ORF Transcript_9076/g.19628 Transcript_9076/m.19628 type:complete len:219 (+) Transcript_9076:1360-2016(+)